MELILVKPIKKLGKIGNLVNVKSGFGRNWLIPQGFAIRATEQNKKLVEEQKGELEAKNTKIIDEAKAGAKLIDKKSVIFIRQCGTDGRLFGSVSTKEIAKELSKISSYNISHSSISLDTPIKSIGAFLVEVLLHAEVSACIIVAIGRSESEAHDALVAYNSATSAVL
jgi:large subunit ribosomal protein L9